MVGYTGLRFHNTKKEPTASDQMIPSVLNNIPYYEISNLTCHDINQDEFPDENRLIQIFGLFDTTVKPL